MRDVRFLWLDVFTDSAFGGNQLAVIPDAEGLSTKQMQRIANELHLSETVFVLQATHPDALRRLRIFTPAAELPYAGHPTIGAAAVLAELGVGGPTFTLQETAGLVEVAVTMAEGAPIVATLTAPQPLQLVAAASPVEIARLLSLAPEEMDATIPPIVSSVGLEFLLVPVVSDDALNAASIDMSRWRESFAGTPSENVYVFTAPRDGRLRARMFAPALGVPEDPATGAAATALAGYLASRFEGSESESALRWEITQGDVIGRPSRLTAEADILDGQVTVVRVGGPSVRIGDGVLRVPD